MGYKVKRIMMWVNQVRLPSAYQEVERIRSNGSQYFDTGFYPTGNSEIEIDFVRESGSNVGTFGVDSGWTRNAFSILNDRIFCYGSQYQSPDQNYYTIGTRYLMKFKNLTCTLNGVTKFTYSSNSFTSSYSAYMFAKRRNNYIEAYSNITCYSLKLWDNGTLARDYVPCYRKSDGVIGMYDLVNNTFNTNQGSGTFTKGADVTDIVEKQVRPTGTNKVLFDFGDWTDSQWTVGPGSSAQQGTITKTATYISFYNRSNNTSNYLSQYPIDGTKDFLLEFRGNIPNTSLSYHGIGITTAPNGNNIDFHTNRESTYRNKIWCETYDGTTAVRQGGETNPGTADYFIKKEGNVLTMGRNGATKYTTSSFPFASTYYLNEGVYRSTATIYTAKLTYL